MVREPPLPGMPATDVLKEIHGRLGFVPQIYQELSVWPDLLRAIWDGHRRVLPDGTAESRCRCAVALAVAAVHGCRYLVDFYTAMLHQAGVSAEELEGLMATVHFSGGTADLVSGVGLSQAVDPELLPYLPHRGRPL
jgi:AhpD family alkylhydroperoxidase